MQVHAPGQPDFSGGPHQSAVTGIWSDGSLECQEH